MNKKVWITLFIVFIMIASVIGFISTQSEKNNTNSFDYNGHNFNLIQEKYVTLIDNNQYFFDYSPKELESIEIPNFNLVSKYYFIYGPKDMDDNLRYDMQKLGYFLDKKNIQAVLACDKDEKCSPEMPIKDCSNNAFYFKRMNESNVYLDENCVVIEGNNEDLSKFVDKIDMKIIGII